MMSRRNRRLPLQSRTGATLVVASTALLLGACASSADSHYFTLMDDGSTGAPTTASAPIRTGGSPLLIEVQPVNVPSQVSRPQIVTTTGPGKIDIHDYDRWSSTLGDEIGSALSQSLSGTLGAIDTYRTPRPPNTTVYRITMNVQRFESVEGDHAAIDAVWSVVRSSDQLTLTCRSSASKPIGSGYPALAAGHRQALADIATQIAQGVRREQAVPVVVQDSDAVPAGKKKAGGTGTPATTLPTLSCPS